MFSPDSQSASVVYGTEEKLSILDNDEDMETATGPLPPFATLLLQLKESFRQTKGAAEKGEQLMQVPHLYVYLHPAGRIACAGSMVRCARPAPWNCSDFNQAILQL